MKGEGEGEREEEEKRTQKTTTLDEKTLMKKLEGIVGGVESEEGVETDDKGEVLMHAIAQDYKTGEVLMLAHMNKEALRLTLQTGKAHYWSRSRRKIWRKGETSGNEQIVKDILIDCDGDAILLKVEQKGGACHTGYRSCFYRRLNGEIVSEKVFDPAEKYGKARETKEARRK
ncbi:MAG: phosphoribosyl-AMP cyclohydrolase [Candidatus Methanospirare jalkutatii]|nr:phosphoribosyl-AMP cyclohydrolase [Candidatus Methanospirare jalkutatii]